MKTSLFTILSIACTLFSIGQNRINYNQYMHNTGIINPAFSDKTTNFGGNVMARKQWLGLPGTPLSALFHGFYNINEKHGIAVNGYFDQQDKFSQFEIGGNYAYTIFFGESELSFGAKMNIFQQSVQDGYTVQDPTDPTLSSLDPVFGLNFGAGVHLTNNRYFIGASAPFLFANEIVSDRGINYSAHENHFYFTGGVKVRKSRNFTFYPTTLIKVTSGSPVNASLDLNMVINKSFWLSFGGRTDLAGIISAGILTENGARFIYSFESNFGRDNIGFGTTHEISVGYGLSIFDDLFSQRKIVRSNGRFKTRKAKRINR